MSEIDVEAVEYIPPSPRELITTETVEQEGPWLTEAREIAGWE